ncbi:cytochrome d ubiquinol oxidase subunit II [Nonomuraea sp. NPDC059194]|uniref:cytochrome d ubiquinol oxidase subunit II n=1 Tax=Nonomuraea sp. NPDC059194 TaxID=3346764 RepID=UPI0036A87A4F
MELADGWFMAIALLWTGYFVLEGFDFGVGMLLPVLARDETERRVMINTIGPVWDGNEVWVITAAGATFAAFPEWYATLFSTMYLPLLLILVALILRGVAFEYRGTRDSDRWRANWDTAITVGSLLPAFLWGMAFGNIVRGVRLDERHEYVGTFWDLLNPYALFGGVTMLAVFVMHGAIFLGLKTRGDIRVRANLLAGRVGIAATAAALAFLAWTQFMGGSAATVILAVAAAAAMIAALGAIYRRREGWAFSFSAAAIAATIITLFAVLYPNVMPSTLTPLGTLTVDNAAATPKTLGIMTWVAVIFLPLVLIYQGWTYWVFRRRISVDDIPSGSH